MATEGINTRAFEIEREGSTYNLPTYTVGENGLEQLDDMYVVEFVKGNIDGPEFRQDGIITENLLTMVAEHLKLLNVGELRNRDTSLAITHIEDAVLRLENRKRDRQMRKVLGTYKK